YAPKCARYGCKTRTVQKATRSFVFVRPALLIVDDRVELDEPDVSVVWAAHLTKQPALDGDLASALVGGSRVDVRTLEPAGAPHRAPREPTPSGEGSHRANKPWGPMWRLEVESPTGARSRGFLHAISAGPAALAPPPARSLSGQHVRGVALRGAGESVGVLWAEPDTRAEATLDGSLDVLVVAGLTPGRRYRVDVDGACHLAIAPADGGASLVATSGGFVRTSAHCGAH
ncbi:MAG TPA: hypothetical protein VLJ38_05745, partial [Polyangiaceae bacterium]|nr:hypothetical protein [Polyangiaceae bacterium]